MAVLGQSGLPAMTATQVQKHIANNDLGYYQNAVFGRVESRSSGGPPGSPINGQAWIVDQATGAWAGADINAIAIYINGGWEFYAPRQSTAPNIHHAGLPKPFIVDENIQVTWSETINGGNGGWLTLAATEEATAIFTRGGGHVSNVSYPLTVGTSWTEFIGDGITSLFSLVGVGVQNVILASGGGGVDNRLKVQHSGVVPNQWMNGIISAGIEIPNQNSVVLMSFLVNGAPAVIETGIPMGTSDKKTADIIFPATYSAYGELTNGDEVSIGFISDSAITIEVYEATLELSGGYIPGA